MSTSLYCRMKTMSRNTSHPNSSFLICIPVYNEARNIEEILSKVEKASPGSDILVVDDGSRDATPEILSKQENIHIIRHQTNQGYGQSLIEGFKFALEKKYTYIITIDSDKQHQPKEIKKFIQLINTEEWDIISGSRYLEYDPESIGSAPQDRREVNARITQKINQLTGYRLTDAFCGFKLYKTEALRKLKLTEPGYSMPLQLWIQAWKNQFSITEVPVSLIYLDKNINQTSNWRNVFTRYRYYLQTIEKELKAYENISTGSPSR